MVIENMEEIKDILNPKPQTFMITSDEIKAIHGMVRAMGGSVVVRQKIIKVLETVVHRTG